MKQNRILSFGMAQLISEEEINQVAAGQANLTMHLSNNLDTAGKDVSIDQ